MLSFRRMLANANATVNGFKGSKEDKDKLKHSNASTPNLATLAYDTRPSEQDRRNSLDDYQPIKSYTPSANSKVYTPSTHSVQGVAPMSASPTAPTQSKLYTPSTHGLSRSSQPRSALSEKEPSIASPPPPYTELHSSSVDFDTLKTGTRPKSTPGPAIQDNLDDLERQLESLAREINETMGGSSGSSKHGSPHGSFSRPKAGDLPGIEVRGNRPAPNAIAGDSTPRKAIGVARASSLSLPSKTYTHSRTHSNSSLASKTSKISRRSSVASHRNSAQVTPTRGGLPRPGIRVSGSSPNTPSQGSGKQHAAESSREVDILKTSQSSKSLSPSKLRSRSPSLGGLRTPTSVSRTPSRTSVNSTSKISASFRTLAEESGSPAVAGKQPTRQAEDKPMSFGHNDMEEDRAEANDGNQSGRSSNASFRTSVSSTSSLPDFETDNLPWIPSLPQSPSLPWSKPKSSRTFQTTMSLGVADGVFGLGSTLADALLEATNDEISEVGSSGAGRYARSPKRQTKSRPVEPESPMAVATPGPPSVSQLKKELVVVETLLQPVVAEEAPPPSPAHAGATRSVEGGLSTGATTVSLMVVEHVVDPDEDTPPAEVSASPPGQPEVVSETLPVQPEEFSVPQGPRSDEMSSRSPSQTESLFPVSHGQSDGVDHDRRISEDVVVVMSEVHHQTNPSIHSDSLSPPQSTEEGSVLVESSVHSGSINQPSPGVVQLQATVEQVSLIASPSEVDDGDSLLQIPSDQTSIRPAEVEEDLHTSGLRLFNLPSDIAEEDDQERVTIQDTDSAISTNPFNAVESLLSQPSDKSSEVYATPAHNSQNQEGKVDEMEDPGHISHHSTYTHDQLDYDNVNTDPRELSSLGSNYPPDHPPSVPSTDPDQPFEASQDGSQLAPEDSVSQAAHSQTSQPHELPKRQPPGRGPRAPSRANTAPVLPSPVRRPVRKSHLSPLSRKAASIVSTQSPPNTSTGGSSGEPASQSRRESVLAAALATAQADLKSSQVKWHKEKEKLERELRNARKEGRVLNSQLRASRMSTATLAGVKDRYEEVQKASQEREKKSAVRAAKGEQHRHDLRRQVDSLKGQRNEAVRNKLVVQRELRNAQKALEQQVEEAEKAGKGETLEAFHVRERLRDRLYDRLKMQKDIRGVEREVEMLSLRRCQSSG